MGEHYVDIVGVACSIHAAPTIDPKGKFPNSEVPVRTATGIVRQAGSERPDGVEELLTVARLLHVGDLAAAAIGDAGLGDLG